MLREVCRNLANGCVALTNPLTHPPQYFCFSLYVPLIICVNGPCRILASGWTQSPHPPNPCLGGVSHPSKWVDPIPSPTHLSICLCGSQCALRTQPFVCVCASQCVLREVCRNHANGCVALTNPLTHPPRLGLSLLYLRAESSVFVLSLLCHAESLVYCSHFFFSGSIFCLL